VAKGRALESHAHRGKDIRSIQQRGEYVYTASGSDGLVIYDIANLDNKGFSQRIQTAPVSPLGQRFYVRSADATAVAAPSTMALDPTRPQYPVNEEQKIHPMYGYVYFTDRKEGLIVVPAATLLDGDPTNNFLERAATCQPRRQADRAENLTIVGTYVRLDRPRPWWSRPERPSAFSIVAEIGEPALRIRATWQPVPVRVCLRRRGVKVLDVTTPESPRATGTTVRVPPGACPSPAPTRTWRPVRRGW
jgi:hypothetical protein